MAVVFTAVGWGVASELYGSLPSVPTVAGLPLFVLAGLEAVAALIVRRRIGRREVGSGLHDLHPMTVARAMVLAKASAIVGAVLAGGWLGLLIYLVPQQGSLAAARADLGGTIFGLVASVLLTAAAVWLERECEVPPDERSSRPDTPDR